MNTKEGTAINGMEKAEDYENMQAIADEWQRIAVDYLARAEAAEGERDVVGEQWQAATHELERVEKERDELRERLKYYDQWDDNDKTCGELSCDDCDARFLRMKEQLKAAGEVIKAARIWWGSQGTRVIALEKAVAAYVVKYKGKV